MATPQKSNSSANKSKKWKASASVEMKKLGASREGDWNLAGVASMPQTRTRGTKAIIDQPTTADNSICLPCIIDTTGESIIEPDDNSTAVSSLTNDHSTISLSKKPPASRVIVKVNPVTEMLEEHLQCPKCNHKMEVSFPTICLASSV